MFLTSKVAYNSNTATTQTTEEHEKETRKGNKSAFDARNRHTVRETTLPNYLSDEYNII